MRKHATILTRIALLVGALFMATDPASLQADEASAALAKYREPVDQSIDKALKWLAENQKDDGSFTGQYGDTTAVPALVGMAFLSKGYTPSVKPYGDRINKCIDYVLKHEQQADGKPNGYLVRSGQGKMYAHCISTLFLSEVSGMIDPSRQRKIDDVMPRALDLIIKAQEVKKSKHLQGGWRYEPHARDSDLSLTGWAVMALRSARLNGAAVPNKTIDEAVAFILNCDTNKKRKERRSKNEQPSRRDKGQPPHGFAYQPNGSAKPAMTGVAILCLILSGHHNDELLPEAGDYLLGHLPGKSHGSHPYYKLYYCSQAMFQLEDHYWDKWAASMYDHSLKSQKEDGSWGDGYKTAMTVLSMTVSYRQLPVYQR